MGGKEAISSVSVNKVVRALFVFGDVLAAAELMARVGEMLPLNAVSVATIHDALAHLSEEAVDAVVAGVPPEDGTLDELLGELGTRHPGIPAIVIASGEAAVQAFAHGAFDVLDEREAGRLGTTILRSIRDADLARALRTAHDELQGILTASDRQTFLLAHAPALIWTTDDALTLQAVDGSHAAPAAVGTAVAMWDTHADESERALVLDAHRRALAGVASTLCVTWLGRARYLSVAPLREHGRVIGTIGTALDVADSIAAGEPLMRNDNHDIVTDLPNRSIFEQRVAIAIGEAERTGRRAAVLFLDVDRFKTVNDLGSHAAGDAVLRALAHRLYRAIGEHDALARFSADEFVMLCVDVEDPTDVERIAARVLESFATPFTYGAHEFHLTASIGLSFAPDDAGDAATLIAQAEAAQFEAKRRGRNVLQRYVPALLATPGERHTLQRELVRAIEREQLDLVYQPVFGVESGRIVSLEALVRWRHPTLGMIVPDRFIPMAEESGAIDRIGEWVITKVCEQIRAWIDAGIETHVSLNVSARQLEKIALVKYIGAALASSGIPASALEIEVTETSILRDVYAATQLLRELRAMGLRVAIDDFGAGFTSLAFLRDLPVDDLKIDRSFVRDVATGAFDGAVVRAVITLARTLGLRTVAEGVESIAQMDVLRELRCDAVQGFLFSMPLSVEECTPLLRTKSA
jgi:diguanylate cyclase (GGDEF)-like protein